MVGSPFLVAISSKCRSSRQVPSPLGTLQPPKPVQPVFVEESPANRILSKLTGDEQKAVKTAAFDLPMNPAHPGLKLHQVDRAKDKDF